MISKIFRALMLASLLGAQGQCQWLFTDDQQKPRDYRSLTPIQPVEPKLWDQVPWQQVAPGQRRKVLYNDRLTMVWLEMDPAPQQPQLLTHYHAHDQITMIVEGKAKAQVGDQRREVGPGAAYVAPSNVHHGLRPLSSRLVLVECFTPTREDFRGMPQPPVPVPCTSNQVRALVYQWFSLFDRQADAQDFFEKLDPEGWVMSFPDQTMRSPEEFRSWWQGLRVRYPKVSHEVLELLLKPVPAGFLVDLKVAWTPEGSAPLLFRQHWQIRDFQGWPVVQSIQVESIPQASGDGRSQAK